MRCHSLLPGKMTQRVLLRRATNEENDERVPSEDLNIISEIEKFFMTRTSIMARDVRALNRTEQPSSALSFQGPCTTRARATTTCFTCAAACIWSRSSSSPESQCSASGGGAPELWRTTTSWKATRRRRCESPRPLRPLCRSRSNRSRHRCRRRRRSHCVRCRRKRRISRALRTITTERRHFPFLVLFSLNFFKTELGPL